ncbi:hypothetical protein [Acidovorax carolinensis]|uniref:hypothetical protein n=1 Tax=Acidovorax carolinensis TaxID=553814 RepID=UPI001F1F7D99|nr:hypothetical protein [Acidovorax carolinensis]
MTTSSTTPSQSPTPTPAQPSAKAAAAGTVPAVAASKVKKVAATEPKAVAKVPAKTIKRAAAPTTAKAKPAPAPVSPAKEARAKKPKLVRDSFTIPKDEYAVIETLKQRADSLAQPAKKSELLRAGLKLLAGLPDAALRTALQAVPSIKTGRPKADVPATKTAGKAVRK